MRNKLIDVATGLIFVLVSFNNARASEQEPNVVELKRLVIQLQARIERLEHDQEKNRAAIAAKNSLSKRSLSQEKIANLNPETSNAKRKKIEAAEWSPGFYIGSRVGVGLLKSNSESTISANPGGNPFGIVPGPTTTAVHGITESQPSLAVGLKLGYDYELAPRWIAGISSELSTYILRNSQTVSIDPCIPSCTGSFKVSGSGETSLSTMLTGSLRVGAISGSDLWFASAGWSIGKFQASLITTPLGGTFYSATQPYYANGPTFGLGWEKLVGEGWYLAAEYQVTKFLNGAAKVSSTVGSCSVFGTCQSSTTSDQSNLLQAFKIGINRRFSFD